MTSDQEHAGTGAPARGAAGAARTMGRRAVLGAGVVLLAVAAGATVTGWWRWWAAPRHGECPICHRHESSESRVTFRASGEGVTEACCLGCAFAYGRQASKDVTIVSVTDHGTGKAIDPNGATFVIGSDVVPCTHGHAEPQVGPEGQPRPVRWDRCLPSILAFASESAAEAFQRVHGGRLRTLAVLREELGSAPAG